MYRTLLKREESYAIHALINIAENPGTNAAQIAEDLKMPPAFMAKVLRKLVTAKFIASKQGRSGGVYLSVDPESINLITIIEAISGNMVLDTCQTLSQCATQRRKGQCRLKQAWLLAHETIREALSAVTLEQLVESPEYLTDPL